MPRRASINRAAARTLMCSAKHAASHSCPASLSRSLWCRSLYRPASVMRSCPAKRSAIIIAASRSAVPLHCSNSVSTTNPFRFSISTLPQYASFDSCPPLFRASRASGPLWTRVYHCSAFRRGSSPLDCRDHLAAAPADPYAESSYDLPRLRSVFRLH